MEGMNLGAMFLSAIAMSVAGLTSLIALGALLVRRYKAARLAFATGALASAILGALVSLTYLGEIGPSTPSGMGAIFLAMAISLGLAGVGQFIAAIRLPGRYLTSLALSLMAAGVLVAAIPMSDLFGSHPLLRIRFDTSLALAVLTISLALAVASCAIALTSTEHKPPVKGKTEAEV